jgi:hypothetical protein
MEERAFFPLPLLGYFLILSMVSCFKLNFKRKYKVIALQLTPEQAKAGALELMPKGYH